MHVKIIIDCETINELHSHLTEIAKQVKRSARKQKLDPQKDQFRPEDADSFNDDNCYGSHEIEIISE